MLLEDNEYRVDEVKIVDLFCLTNHSESVALLVKNKIIFYK